MILFLPPLGGGPSFWDLVRRDLTGVATVASDLCGAAAQHEEERGLSAVTDAVAASLVGPPSLVVGLSLGGVVALDLCARYPERVRGLVLADTVPTYPQGMVEMWRERALRARVEGVASLADPTMALWFTPDLIRRGDPRVDEARRVFKEQDPERYARHCSILAEVDLRPVVASLDLPTRVVCGQDDAGPFIEAAQWFQVTMSCPPVTFVPGARHATALERPDVVADVVGTLWRDLTRSG